MQQPLEIIASFLIPTRGGKDFANRSDGLKTAIDSIADNVSDKQRIEVCIKVDDDDPQMIQFCITRLRRDITIKTFVSPRLNGYNSLHEHYRMLGLHARGIWFCPFSDDGIVETKNYDLILDKYKDLQTVILYPQHGDVGGNLYPIIHRHLFELQDGFGPHAHFDVYWERIDQLCKVFLRPPEQLVFRHYRRYELAHRVDGYDIGEERPFDQSDYNAMAKTVQKIQWERNI